jgi:hypothetical protein
LDLTKAIHLEVMMEFDWVTLKEIMLDFHSAPSLDLT